MAKSASRDFLVKKNNVTIAAVTSKSVTVDNQLIETTADDDNGIQEFLADHRGLSTMSMQVEGYTDDDVLSDIGFSATEAAIFLTDITLTRPNGDVISGTFIVQNYSETGSSSDGAVTFTATLVRSGIHTFTPAA